MKFKNETHKNYFDFIDITEENASQYKNLCGIFTRYKIKTLRNHGETPGSKKIFCKLFDNIISRTADGDTYKFILMVSGKEIIGFASVSITTTDIIDIAYNYGTINDFYISPKNRGKGLGRILNTYIEDIFNNNGTSTVLLHPDPISGIPFWKAMNYRDTGINQGWGHYLVYCKHLILNERSAEIDRAISELVTPTDLININPYNKAQLKEVYGVWKEYCKEINLKPHINDIKKMAWDGRKNKSVSFKALYYNGKIIGFIFKAEKETRYVLSEYTDMILNTY